MRDTSVSWADTVTGQFICMIGRSLTRSPVDTDATIRQIDDAEFLSKGDARNLRRLHPSGIPFEVGEGLREEETAKRDGSVRKTKRDARLGWLEQSTSFAGTS